MNKIKTILLSIVLILSLFNSSSVLGNNYPQQSLLQGLAAIPDHQKTADEKTQEANYGLQAMHLRTMVKELYFGNHKVALENYKEMKTLNHIQAERSLPFTLMDHEEGKLTIIEKDGYYFIEEDNEPNGALRVLLKNAKGKLMTILIPESKYKEIKEKFKKDKKELNRYWAKKPEKAIFDPISALLELDDRHFNRELVERVNKTVEYRRNKKWTFWK